MTIQLALPDEFDAIATALEDSVRATQDFLTEAEITELRPRLIDTYLPTVDV